MSAEPAPVPQQNCLAGIDEAGLGPILGPLVVAGVALLGPAGRDPWKLLGKSVCRNGSAHGRVRIADSKKVHQGERGLVRLEHTVLSFLWSATGSLPATLEDLLLGFSVDVERLRRCPWYADLELRLPLCNDRGVLELAAHALSRDMRRHGVEVLRVACRPVDVEEWNELIGQTDNKSRAHFQSFAAVIGDLLERVPAGAHVVADRCGNIAHYRPGLRRCCPRAEVRTVHEDEAVSSYELGLERGPVRITFATGGEDRALPTALASCLAKYVRELMVERINCWFAARVPGVRPTAGYYTDGLRFLADVGAIVESRGFPRSRLIRVR